MENMISPAVRIAYWGTCHRMCTLVGWTSTNCPSVAWNEKTTDKRNVFHLVSTWYIQSLHIPHASLQFLLEVANQDHWQQLEPPLQVAHVCQWKKQQNKWTAGCSALPYRVNHLKAVPPKGNSVLLDTIAVQIRTCNATDSMLWTKSEHHLTPHWQPLDDTVRYYHKSITYRSSCSVLIVREQKQRVHPTIGKGYLHSLKG